VPARLATGRRVGPEHPTARGPPGDEQPVALREPPAPNESLERGLADGEVRVAGASEDVIDESVGGDRSKTTPPRVDERLTGLIERHRRRGIVGHNVDRRPAPIG
jgi:hypothetical protein